MHIIGAGGHAKVIIDILSQQNLPITGIWDDNKEIDAVSGFKKNGDVNEFKWSGNEETLIAIGNNSIRKKVTGQLHAKFGKAIHPSSAIAGNVEIGEGTVIMANTSLNVDSFVGKHVILNTNASVDHDCRIADYVHVSPQVGLAGGVEVGEGTHIGIGASVIQGIKIGKWATIGAGAVIIRDVPDYAVVVGNPGRIIKYNNLTNNGK